MTPRIDRPEPQATPLGDALRDATATPEFAQLRAPFSIPGPLGTVNLMDIAWSLVVDMAADLAALAVAADNDAKEGA